MAIPLSYSMRNLWKRRLTTILTVSGMALVVFVFAAVLMMAAGLPHSRRPKRPSRRTRGSRSRPSGRRDTISTSRR